MNKLSNAIYEINCIDELSNKNCWINNINPTVKLILTISYILIVVSFDRYNLSNLILMFIYPIIIFSTNNISLRDALRRLRFVMPLIFLVGIFNPFFDKEILFNINGIGISTGIVSMITLIIKGILTCFSSYLLIITTSIEKICYSLRRLHFPKIFVIEILLIYRYITVLLKEASNIIEAYSLRAPNQKGIHYKVWASLIGQLLLRSMDKAENIYESMCLRGYSGEFYYGDIIKCESKDYIYLISCIVIFIVFRFFYIL